MAESRLAEIYRQELKKKGLLGALVSASGERFKEKTDIRRILPQTGISGAAFEKMFGKKYKYASNKDAVREVKGGSDATLSKTIEEKITRLGVDGKITAKNSMSLPVIASQMNIMQKNIAKMVKLSGGTPTSKADSFFKDSKFRENAYESKYNKINGPTPVNASDKKESDGFLGFLSSLLGGAKDIVSSFSGFFKGLFGVILASGIIGQFLDDPETRKALKDFFVKFLSGFFEGVKKTFEVIGEALKDPAVQEAIAGAIRAIFNAILEVFKVQLATIETPFGDLKITIGDVVAAFVGFKIAMGLLEAAILMRAANIRGGGSGGVDVPDIDRKTPNKGGGTDKNGRKLPPRDPKTGRFMKRAPGGGGGVKGFKGLGGPIGMIAGALFLDSLFANDEMADATYSILENSPFFDKITDDEMEKFIGLIENKKYDSANAYHQELAKKNGYDAKKKGWGLYGFDYEKSKTPVAVPSAAAAPVDPNVVKTASESSPSKASSSEPIQSKNSPSKSTDKFDFAKYKELVGKRESGGSYQGDNKVGFIGKYQFGAQALETYGYLKTGTSTDRMAVYSPSNWTGKGGIKSAEDFKKDTALQENLMMRFTDDNIKTLSKMGVISGKETGAELASKLYAAHHGGAGNAAKFFKEGKDTADFAFANASVGKSATLMASAYESGNISGAEWSGTSATSLASANSPRQETQVASSGNALVDLFNGYSQYRDEFMKQSGGNVTNVNAPVTNVAQSNSGGGGGNVNPYNTDMMKYLLRPLA